jgi:hypothetical protein
MGLWSSATALKGNFFLDSHIITLCWIDLKSVHRLFSAFICFLTALNFSFFVRCPSGNKQSGTDNPGYFLVTVYLRPLMIQ